MLKMIGFNCNNEDDMFILRCTLPLFADILFQKSTDFIFDPFTGKIGKDIIGGPSIVFSCEFVLDECFIRKSTNLCISILDFHASHLYTNSLCQPKPTGFFTSLERESNTQQLTPRQKKSCSSDNMIFSYFRKTRPDCEIERKKLIASV